MKKMPVIFVGHGSPMNAIEENQFVEEWKKLKNIIPTPKAILSVSAHWFTRGSRIMTSREPKLIYDMYGFPEELYKIVYATKGAPQVANEVRSLLTREVTEDNSWGIDHGTWSVLRRIYPKADIPVLQLSIDANATAREHYKMGQELRKLREQGILIFGSGNVVHNLARVNWDMEQEGFDWAETFDRYILEAIQLKNHDAVIDYKQVGSSANLSFTTMEHFAPLLYVLGASRMKDQITVFNQSCVLGSLSMTSYLFEEKE